MKKFLTIYTPQGESAQVKITSRFTLENLSFIVHHEFDFRRHVSVPKLYMVSEETTGCSIIRGARNKAKDAKAEAVANITRLGEGAIRHAMETALRLRAKTVKVGNTPIQDPRE